MLKNIKNNGNMDDGVRIRAGYSTLSFLVGGERHDYPVKSGMSLSANLREAFRSEPYITGGIAKATLMVATPVVLVPYDEYVATEEDFDAEAMYGSVMKMSHSDVMVVKELPDLGVVALFPVNSDLQMVVGDNSAVVEVGNVMLPVWTHLYANYYQTGKGRRLFAYFHDRMMDVCSFEHRRIRYANAFEAQHAHDSLYYLLYVWKQLGMNAQEDELYIIGDALPHGDWLLTRLRSYISNVEVVDDVNLFME